MTGGKPWNVALTALSAPMVTVHMLPDTLSHPLQPRNRLPNAGVAVKVTAVFQSYEAEQIVPQSICVVATGWE